MLDLSPRRLSARASSPLANAEVEPAENADAPALFIDHGCAGDLVADHQLRSFPHRLVRGDLDYIASHHVADSQAQQPLDCTIHGFCPFHHTARWRANATQ